MSAAKLYAANGLQVGNPTSSTRSPPSFSAAPALLAASARSGER